MATVVVVVDPVDYVEAVEEELIHQGKMVKLQEGGLWLDLLYHCLD